MVVLVLKKSFYEFDLRLFVLLSTHFCSATAMHFLLINHLTRETEQLGLGLIILLRGRDDYSYSREEETYSLFS